MDIHQWLPHAAKSHGISEACAYHASRLLENLFRGTPWALKMIDASSKVPASLADGNILDFGNYDECLDIDVNEDWGSFVGQHCVSMVEIPIALKHLTKFKQHKNVKVQVPPFIPLGLSICTPSSCTPGDLQYVMSHLGNHTVIDPLLCHTRNSSTPFSTIEWVTIALMSILLLLCIVSTAYDLLVTGKDKNKTMLIFSWYTNGKMLFNTDSGSESLKVLHGLRALSIGFVVFGHVSLMSKAQPTINYLHVIKSMKEWAVVPLANSPLVVDTFFVISGTLLCFAFLKLMEAGHRFNLPIFYFHRYMRIIPVLGLVVLFNNSILRRMGNGPVWDYFMTKSELTFCSKYWWSTLLFVQNYVNPQELCITPSWFLAVDMQMYWISPIFLLALFKKPKLGKILLLLATVIGLVVVFVETYIHGDSPDNTYIGVLMNDRYFYTHTRYVPWVIGVACGYLLHKTTDWRMRLEVGTASFPRKYVVIGWVLFAVCFVGIICALYPFEQEDYVYNPLEASLYFAIQRPVWSLCIVWIIFASSCGVGGWVNTFLAWKTFRPLGRLSFCVYLVHFDVLQMVFYSLRVPKYKTPAVEAGEFFTILITSILVAIILSISVETPIIKLEKFLFRKGTKKQAQQNGGQLQTFRHEKMKEETFNSNLDPLRREFVP